MDTAQILVTLGGGALIVGVLVFFFAGRRRPGPTQGPRKGIGA